MNAPFNARNGGDKRIFSDIRIADLIEKSKNLAPPTKEIEVERLIAESRQSATVKGQPSGERETETGNIHAEAKKAYESFPNLFSKEEREAWYKTESFRKTGLSVSDVENLVQSEEEKIQGLKPSTDKKVVTFSKTKELDRKFGYRSSEAESGSESRKNYVLARVESVTKDGNTEEAVRTLNEKAKSAGLPAEYRIAEIKADGRITRKIAGPVNAGNLASERERILYAGQAVQVDFTGTKKKHAGVQDMVREQIEKNTAGKAVNLSSGGSTETTSVGKGYGDGHSLKAESSDSGENSAYKAVGISGETPSTVNGSNNDGSPDVNTVLTEGFKGSGSKTGSSQSKKKLTPEENEAERMARINANYEHDRAVLAKSDPMFARNEFWDVGHAEGSGEVTDRELAKLAQIKIEEKKNRLLDGGNFNEY